ncbi:isoprenylcysteine carboxylmethyltransferase family protein [candidate division KSB1 bacterium]|nr:isoprenylcysteine carboxylmethyltransferase family protein [candidate division KSB1 bacterium]
MDLREKIFNYRSYTPIPLAIAMLILAEPTLATYGSGLLLILIGESIRVWGVGYAGSATRTTSGVGGDILVVAGPFAHVRNPLYLGNFILTLGICIMAWAWMPWMLLLYMALFGFQYAMIISLEEEHLQLKFGARYTEYRKLVPRFFPRFTAAPLNNPGLIFELKTALRSEKSTLANIAFFLLIIAVRGWCF